MNFLFECAPINPATGVPTTYRFSSLHGKSGSTLVDGKEWESAIVAAPEETVTYYQAGLVQQASIDYGSISLQLTAGTANLANMLWDGATGRVWVGVEGQELSAYEKFFEGVLGAHSKDGDQLKIPLYGLDFKLNETDILTSKYGGTGGVEGPVSIKGTFKPRAYGYCRYVTPIRIDTAYVVYQVHDGACQNIPAVYENAITLGDPAFTVSTYAQLIGLTLKPGTWARAPAVGMFRLANEPSGKFTADVVGDVAAGQNLASIATAILVGAGLSASDIDASVASVAGSIAWDAYLTDQATVGETLRKPFADAFLYLTANEFGKFQAGSWLADGATINVGGPNAMFNVIPKSLTLEEASPSNYSVTVNAEKCWTVHDSQDISPAIAELQEGQAAANETAITTKKALDQAVASIVVERARTDAIIDDGVFDRSEKAGQKLAYAGITTDYAKNVAQANIYNVSSTAYANAYAALNTYLSSLSPPWNDITQDTPIVRATWDAAWEGERAAREAILRAIADATAKLANWPSITGDGKPEDNATVGAPNGTQVGGVPVESVVDAIKDGNGVVKSAREQVAATKAILDAAIAKVGADAAQIRVDLVPTIANAKQAGVDAIAAATKISTDLSAEVQRAKDMEDTLRTRIESAQGGADGAYSLIATETTQRKDADSALTQRIDTVISSANTDRTNANTAITNEITARANAIDSVGRRIDSIVTDYSGANGATNTRIQTEELARASGDEALGRRATTLESRAGGAGNLLSNTDLSNLTGWTQTYGSAGLYLNAAGSTWQLGNIENNISFHDVNPNASVYSQVTSDAFAVEGGTFIQFYALAAAHRSRAWVTLFFYDKTGALSDYAGENYGVREGAGGAEINQQDQIGVKSYRVPNTAVAARMALRIYPTMPANDPYTWFARPYAGIAREGQTEWTPYSPGSAKVVLNSTNAAIRDEQDTRASQTLALAIRSNTLEAQFRGEQASFVNTRIANEEIARSTAVEAIAVRSNTLESMFRGETESSLLARIRTEETTRSTADNAIANRATSLEARSTGGGNLITNTDFVTTTGWTPSTNLTGVTHVINAAGDGYHPPGENVLSIFQGPYNGLGSGGYADWFSTRFAVAPNSFIQVYAFLNCHRCQVEFYIAWIDSNGGIFNYAQKPMIGPTNQGGTDINAYTRFGWSSLQVPSNAVAAAVVFRKYDTFYGGDPNSFAWCLRPYAGEARQGQTEWNAYSPGSGKAALIEATARISSEETTRSNADGALSQRIDTVSASYEANRVETARVNQEVINTNAQVASVNQASATRDAALSTRVDNVNAAYAYLPQANVDRYNEVVAANARITSEATASANRDAAIVSRNDTMVAEYNNIGARLTTTQQVAADASGRSSVYWAVTSDLGGGRGGIELRHVNGQYADFVVSANMRIYGNLVVDGTITTPKIAASAVQQIAFQTTTYSINIPRSGNTGGSSGGGGTGGGGIGGTTPREAQ